MRSSFLVLLSLFDAQGAQAAAYYAAKTGSDSSAGSLSVAPDHGGPR